MKIKVIIQKLFKIFFDDSSISYDTISNFKYDKYEEIKLPIQNYNGFGCSPAGFGENVEKPKFFKNLEIAIAGT
jgi:hypothetical protein